MVMKALTVIDFFCGAGGFSEGFRQEGYQVVMGVDNWKPSVRTHNLNHGLDDEPMDMLDFEKSVDNIDALPDTDIIIGSPPCVSFSMSNKAGKADKSLGIRLIESYLRVVAVKKHQPGSRLKAWLMENVPNSRNFVEERYTFEQLNLEEWAKENGYEPQDVALEVKDSGDILVAADYGSAQQRARFVCGEVTSTGNFPVPRRTHSPEGGNGLKPYITLGEIKNRMPPPNSDRSRKVWTDPNYPQLSLEQNEITDHFYDTGVYRVEWRNARYAKVNHPFMGRMSFPEDESRTSRTIMATRSANTREALIYESEYGREGDGQYRLPTIREVSSLMGFPYTYRFIGSEGTKWKQIGNAVCPQMSSALARAINDELGLETFSKENKRFVLPPESPEYERLDTYEERTFDSPPKKGKGSRFRRHTFKHGGMTVALANHSEADKSGEWHTAIYVGSGKNYSVHLLDEHKLETVGGLISSASPGFVKEVENRGWDKHVPSRELQDMYERQENKHGRVEPTDFVDQLAGFISNGYEDTYVETFGRLVPGKDQIPLYQLMTMYVLGNTTLQREPALLD